MCILVVKIQSSYFRQQIKKMKAIILKEAGGVENLIHTEVPKPRVNKDEVLVNVKAISINPADVKARAYDGVLSWIYGNERPVILGWDISGEVVDKGEDVQIVQLGDEVFGMVNFFGNGKAYAEYVAVPANQLAVKPVTISHEEAAAATLSALTAWQALATSGNVKKGDKVLIHAGSGGVGHYAIQIAKHLGAYVIVTSSEKNSEFVLSLGADAHIDYNGENKYEQLIDVDFVLDTVGEEVLLQSIDTVKPGGKIITLPSPQFSEEAKEKAKSRKVDLSFKMVQSNGNDMKLIASLLDGGIMKSHISATFPFLEMDKAHLQVETGRTVGKVVVTL